MRNGIVRILTGFMALILLAGCRQSPPSETASLLELDTLALVAELASGNVSAEQVTTAVLERIDAIDKHGPALNAIIEINPDALAIARELDRRYAQSGPTGPLHGVPVVLKANIDTADKLATTAGSLALAEHHARDDAGLVRVLREAGAVIVAKANLSEWANFRSNLSSSGWSSLGGQTRNPYVLDRNPCGSSSGSAAAVAARLVPLAVGTETDGSIVCPAGANGVVGIKPTRGSVSQQGIIPISHTQDIAGPMARTIRGAALMLSVLQGKGRYLIDKTNLDGLKIGVLRDYSGAGRLPAVEELYTSWQQMLAGAGAELEDPLNLDLSDSISNAELQVLLFEFKADLNAYLGNIDDGPASLGALIAFNVAHKETVMPYFGQELFLASQGMGDLDSPEYREALEQSGDALREKLEAVFAEKRLDAIIAPVNSPAWKTDWLLGDHFALSSSSIAAISGYPNIAIPGGLAGGLPVGMAIIGRPGSEALLIEIAAVFEKARGPFPAPGFVPVIEN